MQSLSLGKDTVTFCISDDPNRIISFNPHDVRLCERVTMFWEDANKKQEEFEKRAKEEANLEEKDENGIPINLAKSATLMRETADWVCEQLDIVFGKGTAKKVFGDTFTFDDFALFMQYVFSFFTQESQERVTKRLNKKSGKVMT